MNLNKKVLETVKKSGKKMLAVTKYFSAAELEKIQVEIFSHPEIIALGENRIDSIIEKNVPREKCHFIGNVQSRDIQKIAENCAVVHSLCKMSHAQKFAQQKNIPDFFIQINVSGEIQKGGLRPTELADFLEKIPENIKIIGVSAIGSYSATESEKKKEFEILNDLRQKNNPVWKISAGTSVDYEQALAAEIDLVRVGRKLFENER